MKNILRNSNFGFTKWCVALVAALMTFATTGWGQTYYDMSLGNYNQTFTGINGNWPANWNTVAVLSTGSIPAATKTTLSTTAPANIASSTAIGQDATASTKLIFLGTGATDNTASIACDLNLNFTGRTAGNLSFDAAEINNSTGDRVSTLKVYYSVDGTNWTEITGTNLPFAAANNVAKSASINVALPASLNNQSTVKLRFYYYNGSGGTTGSRPKISIDNVAVTSTTAGANPEVTSFSPTIGKTGSSITITGANFGSSAPTISFNGTAATVSSFTSTSIVVSVPAGATTGKISVTAGGLTAQSLTDFAVDNTAPLASSTSPADNASSAAPGSIKITFSEAIAKGTGNITIKKISDNSVVETIAVSATQVTASGSVLTIKPTTSLAYSTGFYVEYDAGIVTDLAGNSLAAGISGNSAWNFITRAESPVIITQYYEGVSNNKFIEIANVGGTSLTLTGYSLVLWSNADAEGWKNTNTYTTTSILDLSTVTLAPGQVYVVANSQSVSPIPATSANAQSTITYFNGNDSVVLHYTGGGLTINDPASVVDAVSFTNSGNEGADKAFVRISKAPGYTLDAGSNIAQFTDVWQSVTLATADAATSGTDNYLGYTSLATPPASLAFSSGSVTVNEDVSMVNLTVVLSAATATQVTAAVALDSSSTATTADIGNYATRTVTFAAGSAAGSTQTVAVTITDDSEAELSEKAVFKIQNIVGNAVAGAPETTTINIRPSDNTIANLLISEVPDPSNGSGTYRYIELYNPGATDVDLSAGQWNLVRYSNGLTGAQAIPLTGTVPAGGTFVIASSASFSTGYPAASAPGQISAQINGNGDDVYALYFGGDNSQGLLRDIYGVVGELGAGTWGYAGKRAVRKSSVVAPNPVWTASEWVVASAASAKMTPGAHPDTAPVITSTLTAIATVGTAFEYQIAANNNPTVYSAEGLPAELQFSPTTGLISGTPASATTLSVSIQAINGGGTDSKTLTITIGSPNSAPSVTSAGVVSVPENQTAVQTVVGTDPDAGTTLSYRISGGADSAKFVINSSTGVLTFVSAPDFENPTDVGTNNVYDVIVEVSDGTLTATKAVAVTVTDLAEVVAPSGLSYTPAMISGTVGTPIAALTPTIIGAQITYSIDPALPTGLSIEPTTGVISGTPAAPAASALYTVRATNTAGNTSTTLTVAVVAPGSTYNSWLGAALASDAAFWDYVYGATAPGQLPASLRPTTVITGGNLVLTYYVRQNTFGLTVTAKKSLDLATGPSGWNIDGVTDVPVGGPTTAENGVSVQKRTASVAVSGANKKFLKLEGVQAQ